MSASCCSSQRYPTQILFRRSHFTRHAPEGGPGAHVGAGQSPLVDSEHWIRPTASNLVKFGPAD